MKLLKMHHSNFKYVYGPVIDPLSPSCSNCEFMPDNICGWGYESLEQCVFQIEKGVPYCLYPTHDFKSYFCFADEECHEELSKLLEDAELCGLHPFWSSEDDMKDFYIPSPHPWWCSMTDMRKRLGKRKEQGSQYRDYVKWNYSREPCTRCGKVTKYYTIVGFKDHTCLPVIKLCDGCTYDQREYDEYYEY